jgi:hypothetical protein
MYAARRDQRSYCQVERHRAPVAFCHGFAGLMLFVGEFPTAHWQDRFCAEREEFGRWKGVVPESSSENYRPYHEGPKDRIPTKVRLRPERRRCPKPEDVRERRSGRLFPHPRRTGQANRGTGSAGRHQVAARGEAFLRAIVGMTLGTHPAVCVKKAESRR